MRDLDKEIRELEELAFGTSSEVGDGEQVAAPGSTGATEDTTRGTGEQTTETVTVRKEPEKATGRDWEKDYKALRSNSDNYKFNTRTELAQLKESNLNLNKEIKELRSKVVVPKEDMWKDTFSEDDAKIVGPEALAMMQKAASTAANASTKELQEQLDKERALRLKQEEQAIVNDKQAANAIFLDRLSSVVPDYAEINLDPKFAEFIKGDDPVNGGTRLMHFKNAERSGNVMAVANYMKDFSTVSSTKDSLEDRIAPKGTVSAPIKTDSEQRTLIPQAEITKFYTDVAKGRYKGKQALVDQLTAKYDLAFLNGSIS